MNSDTTADVVKRMTSDRLMVNNTVFNLLGQGLPMLVAIFAIPLLIRGLGKDKFGILTVIWIIVGYFGLFDFGLGRALTKLVAEMLGRSEQDKVPVLVWTCLSSMLGLGILGSVILTIIAPWLTHSVLRIPVADQSEAVRSVYLLAAALPFVISSTALTGLLEALQQFRVINWLRAGMGFYTYLSPLVLLPFSHDLAALTAVLVAGRCLSWFLTFVICLLKLPALRKQHSVSGDALSRLIRFGGWITVSNIIDPLMVYMDRFLIGILISTTAVAYYATPYEVVTKLWVLPSAVVRVLFPAFSISHENHASRSGELLDKGNKSVFIALFPVTLLAIALAPAGLSRWLGKDFALHSTVAFQWLAIGAFVNCLARIPSAFIQAVGRPEVTAILHVIELPLYLPLLWWAVHTHGIEGAAVAWTARIMLDTVLLFLMVKRVCPEGSLSVGSMSKTLTSAFVVLVVATLPLPFLWEVLFIASVLVAFGCHSWFGLLAREERVRVRHLFQYASSSGR